MDEIKRKRGRPPKVKPVEETKPVEVVKEEVPVVEPKEVVPNVVAIIESDALQALVAQPEAISIPLGGEDRLYRDVMLRALTEQVGLSQAQAEEITNKYGRLSRLSDAIKQGVELPIKDDEIFAKLKRLCLCR